MIGLRRVMVRHSVRRATIHCCLWPLVQRRGWRTSAERNDWVPLTEGMDTTDAGAPP
jgi:hypothetical protein